MTIRTNFLKCFAVRAVWNSLQPQISVINVVSNLILVRQRKTLKHPLPQSLVHIINDDIQRICSRSHLRTKSMTKTLHYRNLKHQLLIKSLKNMKYEKISVLLQQLTYEITDKMYFLQEPKKSASAVALLQNQL